MCGIPYHAATSYISRLLAAGKKGGDLRADHRRRAEAFMNRDVVEVITPGTVLDDELPRAKREQLPPRRSAGWGTPSSLAYADVSTGEFCATSFPFAERGGDAEEGAAPPRSAGGAHAGVPARGGRRSRVICWASGKGSLSTGTRTGASIPTSCRAGFSDSSAWRTSRDSA